LAPETTRLSTLKVSFATYVSYHKIDTYDCD
jgi:hypothetical protein